jgi:hypothetical protein
MKRLFTYLLTVFAGAIFLIGCGNNAQQQPPPVATQPQQEALTEEEPLAEDEYWAKDNFDLQRVGPLLQRSRNIGEFERYLNEDDGINNLDLNGDGYADYISVDEFDYGDDPNERGLSLYSRFGPDLVQEIARVIFYRDEPRYPGSRVLLYGNDQIYGDDYYYETNWLDRTIGMVSYIFGDRNDRYRSPYYYDNYPDWYDPYYIVETPVYRTRIERLYPEPMFVYTTSPDFIDQITIRSPHDGQWMDRIYARLVKPRREQQEFRKNNPMPPAWGRRDRADGPGFSEDAPGQRKKLDGEPAGNPGRGNPDKPDKPGKPDKADKDRGGPPERVDNAPPRGNPDKGQGNPNKPDKGQGNPNKPDKPQKADNPNKGGGDKGKGGGKGKGKP